MKKVLAVGMLVMMVVAVTMPMALAGITEKPWKTSPKDLPVLKLPNQGEVLPGGPLGGKPEGHPGKGKPKPDAPPEDPSVNKWALVIGIADYRGVQNDLWHPDEDAKEMKQALMDEYGFPEGNIKILLNKGATAKAILKAIDWLEEKENANSTVVFFYSGHGFKRADADAWDADVEEVDGFDEGIVTHDMYGLIDGFLRDRFSTFETQKFTMIFAQCFSGGMFDDNDDLQKLGRVIPSATKADQYAWDFLDLDNTLFGYYFIDRGILQGFADPSGEVSMEEALAYAQPLVLNESLAIQDEFPEIYTTSEPQIYDGYPDDLIP